MGHGEDPVHWTVGPVGGSPSPICISTSGVMAMVAPVTAFLLLFQNLGLSHAAIQAQSGPVA